MLSVLAWATWGAVLGVVCDNSQWNGWKVMCSAAATCAAAAGPAGRVLTLPGSLAVCVPMFFVGSRVRVVGLTGGECDDCALRSRQRACVVLARVAAACMSTPENVHLLFVAGIASGKSEVSRHLRSLGVPVIDADVIAHQVMERCFPKCLYLHVHTRAYSHDLFVNLWRGLTHA